MTNSLSPRVRADIINYDPAQPGALSVTEFCRSVKVSRSVFYKIRTSSQHESTTVLHPRSRAAKQPARRYGPDVVNELVRIRKQLKADGWDYGPKTIHYEANHPLSAGPLTMDSETTQSTAPEVKSGFPQKSLQSAHSPDEK